MPQNNYKVLGDFEVKERQYLFLCSKMQPFRRLKTETLYPIRYSMVQFEISKVVFMHWRYLLCKISVFSLKHGDLHRLEWTCVQRDTWRIPYFFFVFLKSKHQFLEAQWARVQPSESQVSICLRGSLWKCHPSCETWVSCGSLYGRLCLTDYGRVVK